MSPEERANLVAGLAGHRPALLRLARYLTRSSSAAEDLVQATLLSAIEHIDTWEGRAPLKHWLIRILTHRHHREARNREQAADTATWEQLASAAGWAADAGLDRTERISQVQQALMQLNEQDREVLLLRDVEGIEGNEAAGMLSLSLAAMKSRLHRARLRLLTAVREVSTLPLQPSEPDAMTCMEVLECLGDYADGALDAVAAGAIHAHVSHCDRCRHFSQRYARMLDQLLEIGKTDESSPLTAGTPDRGYVRGTSRGISQAEEKKQQ